MALDNKHRRSIRLREFDYTQPGAYFITICSEGKLATFGHISEGIVTLTRAGQIVQRCWLALPRLFPFVELDEYVVMPNHMHGNLFIVEGPTGAPSAKPDSALTAYSKNAPFIRTPHGTSSGSICAVIQNFKSVSTRRVNRLNGTPGVPLWQRNYYEHIIRNDESLNDIRQYIIDNPEAWTTDEYYADAAW